MTKGREESDDRVVPQNRRKAVQPGGLGEGRRSRPAMRPGAFELFFDTADSPKGADAGRDRGRPRPRTTAAPKSEDTEEEGQSAMTRAVKPGHCSRSRDSCGWRHRRRTTGDDPNADAPKSRMWAHKSGSVGAGGGQPPLATRQRLLGGTLLRLTVSAFIVVMAEYP